MDTTSAQQALHGLAHWALARLFTGTPPAEQIDRAQRVLSGRLARQAPHVVESFATDYESAVTAVSPKGTIAVLGVRRHAGGYSGELIVRAPDGSRSKPAHPWKTPFKPLIKLFFVEGSEDPVCVVDQRLTWRGAEAMLPRDLFVVDGPQFTGMVPSACLCMWVEIMGDRLHVGYVHRGLVCHRELFGEEVADRESPLFREDADVHWLGVTLRPGFLCVLQRGDQQIVRREDGREFALPAGAKICADTIVGSLDGTVQFVYGEASRRYACFWGEGSPCVHGVLPSDIVCVGKGALLFFDPRTGDVSSLGTEWFSRVGGVGEVTLPPGNHGPWKVQDATRDNLIVIDGIATDPRDHDIHYVLRISYRSGGSGSLQYPGDARVLVLHGAMALVADESLSWAGQKFPLYGSSGPRGLGSAFAPGKIPVVVGVAFIDGTVHVLNYRLNP